MLASFVSILLDEGRKRRIGHRVSDQPFQPFNHGVSIEWRPVQASFNLELSVKPDGADDSGGIIAFRQQELRLKFTQRGIETTIRLNHFQHRRQVAEGTMDRTAIRNTSARFDRLELGQGCF